MKYMPLTLNSIRTIKMFLMITFTDRFPKLLLDFQRYGLVVDIHASGNSNFRIFIYEKNKVITCMYSETNKMEISAVYIIFMIFLKKH